jgi:putative acetyltransferase
MFSIQPIAALQTAAPAFTADRIRIPQCRTRSKSARADLEIRESRPEDTAAIASLYPEAFPDENLLSLVRELLSDTVVTISLVGTIDTIIAGHAIFTKCGLVGKSVNAVLLGPLAVAPAWQRQGIGSAIVRAGLRRLEDEDVALVCVLGDPAFYGRLGFLPESLVEPPFPLPAEWDGAWQSRNVGEIRTPYAGKLSVPPQWHQPALWAP